MILMSGSKPAANVPGVVQRICQTFSYWFVLAGKLVLMPGRLLVAGKLLFPPIVPPVLPMLEFVVEASVEPLDVF
jgi:hypothetical protein